MSKIHRLPFGGHTDDQDQYIKEWMSLAEPLSEILEMSIYGIDPMITLNTGVALHPTASFSPDKAKRIIEKFGKQSAK